jgi:putative alpha-1,2-mannosidase
MDSREMMIQVLNFLIFQILFSGTMGAYMTWIMSGLFPIAGQSVYLIIRPAFPAVQWTVTNSRIITQNFGPDNLFIQSVTVDGKPVRPNIFIIN